MNLCHVFPSEPPVRVVFVCEYFEIPYRTMTDWELGNRTMPDYLLRLMAYKVKMENLIKDNRKDLED